MTPNSSNILTGSLTNKIRFIAARFKPQFNLLSDDQLKSLIFYTSPRMFEVIAKQDLFGVWNSYLHYSDLN